MRGRGWQQSTDTETNPGLQEAIERYQGPTAGGLGRLLRARLRSDGSDGTDDESPRGGKGQKQEGGL